MEACCGAHHLGRVFAADGHDVRLMSPEYVRRYIKPQKHGDCDAEGIAEAATMTNLSFRRRVRPLGEGQRRLAG
jgi:transposase